MHGLPGYAQRHRVARPYRKNEQAFVGSFPNTLRKECLGWCSYKLSERENYRRRSKNTWATITTSALPWPSACKPFWHLFVAFDMVDTGPRADLSPPLQIIWLVGRRVPGVNASAWAARLRRSC